MRGSPLEHTIESVLPFWSIYSHIYTFIAAFPERTTTVYMNIYIYVQTRDPRDKNTCVVPRMRIFGIYERVYNRRMPNAMYAIIMGEMCAFVCLLDVFPDSSASARAVCGMQRLVRLRGI